MKKTICCIGSTGFIGSNIYEKLSKVDNFEIYRFSSKKSKFLENCNIKNFDYLICSAGFHPESADDNSAIHLINRKIIKNSLNLLKNSKKIILISSFKTLIDQNEKIISSNNKYNFYEHDTYYGKNKVIIEKLFLKFCKEYKKEYLILCPSHVIGPNDFKPSPNGKFLKNILTKKIVILPKVNISLIDVRNLSEYIKNYLVSDKPFMKKILLSDISTDIKNYANLIKKNEKFYLIITINHTIVKLIYHILKILRSFNFIKVNPLNENTYNYIKLNPKINEKYTDLKISFNQTIKDTVNFFRTN